MACSMTMPWLRRRVRESVTVLRGRPDSRASRSRGSWPCRRSVATSWRSLGLSRERSGSRTWAIKPESGLNLPALDACAGNTSDLPGVAVGHRQLCRIPALLAAGLAGREPSGAGPQCGQLDGAVVITVLGEAVVRLAPTSDETTVRALPGGSALNIAIAAVRLGDPAALMARLSGDPFGQLLRRHAARNGVNLSAAPDADEPTTIEVLPDRGER